jgi:hypothetical protein
VNFPFGVFFINKRIAGENGSSRLNSYTVYSFFFFNYYKKGATRIDKTEGDCIHSTNSREVVNHVLCTKYRDLSYHRMFFILN